MKRHWTYINILSILRSWNNFNEEYSLAAGNLGDLYLLKGEYAKAMELLRSSLQSATNANTRRTMWREYLFAMILSDSPTFITELQRFNKEERINLANLIGTFSENEWENYWIEAFAIVSKFKQRRTK